MGSDLVGYSQAMKRLVDNGKYNSLKVTCNKLEELGIEYKIRKQRYIVDFIINGIKYNYRAKSNRVYIGNESLDLTMVKFLKSFDNEINSNGKTIIHFGKHKGKSLEEVMTIDKSYIDWLLSLNFKPVTDKDYELLEAIRAIIELDDTLSIDNKNYREEIKEVVIEESVILELFKEEPVKPITQQIVNEPVNKTVKEEESLKEPKGSMTVPWYYNE